MKIHPREILSSLANAISDVAVETLGRDSILSVITSGSLAKQDVAGYVSGDVVEVYSDVDLWVVVNEGVNLDDARRRIRAAVAAVPLTGPGYRVYACPDVGVVTPQDLEGQPARPGTVDLVDHHATILGEFDMADFGKRANAASIDATEGLYLLENRLAELAAIRAHPERHVDPGFGRYATYVTLKNCLDVATAVLVAVGRYVGGRSARVAALLDETLRAETELYLPEGGIEAIKTCDFLISHLAQAFDGSADGLGKISEQGPFLMLETWRRIADRLCPDYPHEWEDFIDWRCRRGNWVANMRELLVLGRRLSVPRATIAMRGGWLARYSPIASLRLSGLVETLGKSPAVAEEPIAAAYLDGLDSLTRVFGFADGDLFSRGRAMLKATV
jgi:predicted nucleotidyltransferase